MIKRKILPSILNSLKHRKSILLLGPRQTGKSTLSEFLNPTLEFNLANQDEFLEFIRDPAFLMNQLKAKRVEKGIIFVDEVQRVPSLLNTIQSIVDKNKEIQFVLTGSSARKLKRGKANLLPGRIHSYTLGPIISGEIDYDLDTNKALSYGTLPETVMTSDTKILKNNLKSYATTYLNEEIKAEALTRNIEGFSRFLYSIIAEITHFTDLSKISKLTAVPRQTVQRYYEILEDTLLCHSCDAFTKSNKRRLIQHPKFYFFDNGVANGLLANFILSADRKGPLFENLFYTQLYYSLLAEGVDFRLSSYRTDAGAEVDVILEMNNEYYAIEIKSGGFGKNDLRGLESFSHFVGKKKVRQFVVIPEGRTSFIGDIEVLPWQIFLKRIFN